MNMKYGLLKKHTTEYDILCRELEKIQSQLDECYALFSILTDGELIDAAVYKMKSLEAEYDYVYKRVKECGKK